MNVTLIDRYLIPPDELAATDSLLPYSTTSRDALSKRYLDLDTSSYPRQQLSASLFEYNTAIGNDSAALDNCRQLSDSRSAVVITGQQAGLFSGPLYTIFKIASAIRLAKDEQLRCGGPVIPVFWNATEDHDLSEIATCYLPGQRIEADFPKDGRAGERLSATCLDSVIANLVDATSEDFKETLATLLRRDSDDYGYYSSSVIARLFHGTGLVILEPRLLRPLATPFFKAAISNADSLSTALQGGADRLSGKGISQAFTPDSGTGLFFINTEGIRRQILRDGTNFLIDGETLSEAEVLSKISSAPTSFSTGAWLRPVLQAALLPVLAYIAGPGEYRYHLQLPDVFKQYNTVMPPLRLRNHATLLGQAEARLADKLNLEVDDIFRGPTPFYSTPELPPHHQDTFADSFKQLEGIAISLKTEFTSLGLDRSIDGFLSKSIKDLEKIRSKAGKELERQAGVGNQRVDRFFQSTFPGNHPQERRINVIYFLRYFGRSLIPELINTFEPGELRHYIITADPP